MMRGSRQVFYGNRPTISIKNIIVVLERLALSNIQHLVSSIISEPRGPMAQDTSPRLL